MVDLYVFVVVVGPTWIWRLTYFFWLGFAFWVDLTLLWHQDYHALMLELVQGVYSWLKHKKNKVSVLWRLLLALFGVVEWDDYLYFSPSDSHLRLCQGSLQRSRLQCAKSSTTRLFFNWYILLLTWLIILKFGTRIFFLLGCMFHHVAFQVFIGLGLACGLWVKHYHHLFVNE